METKNKDPVDLVLEELASKIIRRTGYKTPYTIQLSKNLREDADIVIRSGNPVEIYVSNLFLFGATKVQLMDRIDRALQKAKDCHKVLSNFQIINYRESVALLKDAKKWARSANPDAYIDKISTIFFKKEYTVTVTDALTNISVSLTGKNVKELENEAVRKLIHLVESDEEQEEVRELVLKSREKPVTKENLPIEITMSGVNKIGEDGKLEKNDNESIVKLDYSYQDTKIEEDKPLNE